MEAQQDSQFLQYLSLKQSKSGTFQMIGPSYQEWSPDYDAQASINLYPTLSESGSSKGQAALYGTPGITKLCTLGAGPIRCLTAGENRLFAVSGTDLYEIFSNGSFNSLGGVEKNEGPHPVDRGREAACRATVR